MERILCAAVWYKDLELRTPAGFNGEAIEIPSSHLYPVNVDGGVVFCGHRHLQCLYTMIVTYGLKQHEAGEYEEGFLTNYNRFVDRVEGAKIALHCGQIDFLEYSSNELYSEDLY